MKLAKEFKEFITRGNVLDMAVGVIIGGAFSAIVTALTNNILKPLINWLISLIVGGDGALAIYTFLKPVYSDGVLDMSASIYIDWGAFISAIINFLLIALILFAIIKTFNSIRRASELGAENVKLQRIAVKKYRKEGLTKKEAVAKYYNELAEEKAKKEAEEKAKAEAEAAKLTRSEQLLTEIKELLEKKQ